MATLSSISEQIANRLSVLEVEAMPLVDPLLPDPKRAKKH